MVHGDGGSDKVGKSIVDGERDSPVTNEPDPACDEREYRLALVRDLETGCSSAFRFLSVGQQLTSNSTAQHSSDTLMPARPD